LHIRWNWLSVCAIFRASPDCSVVICDKLSITNRNRLQKQMSVYLRVDTSNQLDTDEACELSYAVCGTKVHNENDMRIPVKCAIGNLHMSAG